MKLDSLRTLVADNKTYSYHDIKTLDAHIGDISRLPYSLKVLLENVLRFANGEQSSYNDLKAFRTWIEQQGRAEQELAFRPARVLMQDFTGVPAVVDLAVMRDAMKKLGGNPQKINPRTPVDLVIDHSVMVDHFGGKDSLQRNSDLEFARNLERYEFLRWGASAFSNFRVVPPGTGICHQVNIEYLAQVVWEGENNNGHPMAYPDTVVGTDSHTTMVNGLGVLGWGVGGIEAEAAMLGQPISLLMPEVVGFKLTGKLHEGVIATDLVLRIVEILRNHGVVGKFVEFYGPGVTNLSTADRATIANMAPEYGATCGIFPIDAEVVRYLRFTGRDESTASRVEAYAKAQNMWSDNNTPEPVFTARIELDLASISPCVAGPKRPQDRVPLNETAASTTKAVKDMANRAASTPTLDSNNIADVTDGSVVIAAITSCTNTSNPVALVAAGLLARKARARGLNKKPWVKTSLAPGSQVVTDYLEKAGLQEDLDALGFNLVGYGCTTCIGNSGPLLPEVAEKVRKEDLIVCSALSGNRNFEGRVNPQVKANYLASPHLCVAFAIAGTMLIDLTKDPIGTDQDGNNVFMRDIWPSTTEINEVLDKALNPEMFRNRYSNVFLGPKPWQAIQSESSELYAWKDSSTYVQKPPYFEDMDTIDVKPPTDSIPAARILAILGDSVTTDHISPAGSFAANSPAGTYLAERQVTPKEFNSYGSRRGNHEVMMRGTLANIRIRNAMVEGTEGGYTKHHPSTEDMSIYDAAMRYKKENIPLILLAGKEYGTGSSRDWAAKGTALLGVKVVIAESFERIHRSNLIGMGVLPLEFTAQDSTRSLALKGDETFAFTGLEQLAPRKTIEATFTRADGTQQKLTLQTRIDTLDELQYYNNGGILPYMLRSLHAA